MQSQASALLCVSFSRSGSLLAAGLCAFCCRRRRHRLSVANDDRPPELERLRCRACASPRPCRMVRATVMAVMTDPESMSSLALPLALLAVSKTIVRARRVVRYACVLPSTRGAEGHAGQLHMAWSCAPHAGKRPGRRRPLDSGPQAPGLSAAMTARRWRGCRASTRNVFTVQAPVTMGSFLARAFSVIHRGAG